MAERWEASIPCRDNMGRQRMVAVAINDNDDVVIIAPPGGAAIFHPVDVNRVKEELTRAQVEAIHRRGGRR